MDHAHTGTTNDVPSTATTSTSTSMDALLLLEPKFEMEPLLQQHLPSPPVLPGSHYRYAALDDHHHLIPRPLSLAVPPCEQPPRPLEALLQGPQLPPFLSKTYDLVSEPQLDRVISWGTAGNSFVVWEPSTFARDVLPHNFKHNNFSSFVRQLNTYGFRKVHADRWEFAHEGFLRGSKHLLKTIVRRRSSPTQQSSLQPGSSIFRKTQPSCSSESSTLDPELHSLRREKNALLREVARLKKEHSQTIEHMNTLNQRLVTAEDRQKQVVSFLAKLLQNPDFLRQLKTHRERREEIDSARVKRKFLKHAAHGSIESGDSSSPPRPRESGCLELPAHPIAHDAIADIHNFLLEDTTDLSDGMLPGNFGLDGVEAPEDIRALVHGLDAQGELGLGTGAEMHPASGSGTAHCQDSSIGAGFKGKNVMCPGLDGTSSEAGCLVSLPDMGMVSGAMDGKLVDADDGQIWGVDAYLQSSCSGTGQQAYGSLASDPYLVDGFWELGFEGLLDDGDLQLDKCVIGDPALQQHRGRNMKP
uniref:Uncharacterized protein n=1 Tax=Avena sativa TaxID=4498 RepID=A0ACD5X5S6_AVESA